MSILSDGRAGRPEHKPALPRLTSQICRSWRDSDPFSAPAVSEWPTALKRVRSIGFALLALQLVGFCVWSAVLGHRFSTTVDFSAYNQAAWLIAHGHLDPYSTLLSKPFWKNDGEFLIWGLAVFVRLWPSLLTLPLLQDIALVLGEVVALSWMAEIAARHAQRTQNTTVAAAVVALGIVLLIGNPWFLWTASFDVHMEPFITLFTVLVVRDFLRGRRRVWIWVLLGLSCGSVGASYIGAAGVSAALTSRRLWKRGLVTAAIGFALMLFFIVVHATPSAVLDLFAPVVTGNATIPSRGVTASMLIKAALEHPGRLIDAVWSHKTDMWATISPGGAIGLLWLPVTLPVVLILIEGGLGTGSLLGFAAPGFQNIAIADLLAVGTIALCVRIATWTSRRGGRWRFLLPALMVAMIANSVAWTIVWAPQVGNRWLLVSSGAASTLHDVTAKIHTSDEVIVSQGVAGAFSRRKWLYTIFGATLTVPVRTRTAWIIFTPLQGIEEVPSSSIYADIAELEHDPEMKLAVAANGVWAFKWKVPPGVTRLTLTPSVKPYSPGAAMAAKSGRAVRRGSPSAWYAVSTRAPGYVADGSYWFALPGTYRASASLAVSGRANLELWDTTDSALLAREVITNTHGRRTFELTARLRRVIGQPTIGGVGIWSITPQRLPGDALEVRIWSPGGNTVVKVYRASLKQLSGRPYPVR